jgi:hypothetical protein
VIPAPPPQHVVLHSRSFVVGNFATIKPKVGVPAPDRDGYVTRMSARLVDMRGRPVSIHHVMLHHILFLNDGSFQGAHQGSCEGRHGEPFYGTGEEHQQLRLPGGYGYRVHAGDNWRMQAMLMSHGVQRMRVRVRYDVRFVRRRLTPVRPFWIRANGCDTEHPSYTIYGGGPPGSVARKTWRWRVPFDGRIVAAGGHLHGGSRDMTLTQPGCGGRTLLDTAPLYGRPDHPAYMMRPVLHEPGPINTRYFLSRRGIPIRRGELLALNGLYDGEYARPQVMAIMHLYVARGRVSRATRCAPLPPDRRSLRLKYAGRPRPPHTRVPLNRLSPAGHPYPIAEPPGLTRTSDGDVTTVLRGSRFVDEKLSVPRGARLTWVFADPIIHNVMLANGPRVHGSPPLKGGRRFSVHFDVRGVYQFFCPLHPMTMHQQVTVRAS